MGKKEHRSGIDLYPEMGIKYFVKLLSKLIGLWVFGFEV